MARYFDNQQEYINDLQKELDEGRAAEKEIKSFWPDADADKSWDMGKSEFKVRLRGFGHVWGTDEDEHKAWIQAKRQLAGTGVLSATVFQKMDGGEDE